MCLPVPRHGLSPVTMRVRAASERGQGRRPYSSACSSSVRCHSNVLPRQGLDYLHTCTNVNPITLPASPGARAARLTHCSPTHLISHGMLGVSYALWVLSGCLCEFASVLPADAASAICCSTLVINRVHTDLVRTCRWESSAGTRRCPSRPCQHMAILSVRRNAYISKFQKTAYNIHHTGYNMQHHDDSSS
jgi:hypothetical protein